MKPYINGEQCPDQRAKRRLFFDMDGVLVDFESGLRKIDPKVLEEAGGEIDKIDGIFALMDPMPGAIEAAHTLSRYYDCHILSTSPWGNVGGCSDKMRWVQKYLGDVFYKKVTFTHHKEFLNDGESLLIDDRLRNGAEAFGDRLIRFDAKHPDWKGVTERLVKMAQEEGSGTQARGIWGTSIDELFTKLGLPLTTGKGAGSCVMPVKKPFQSVKQQQSMNKENNHWEKPVDELFTEQGLPLTTGNKTGSVVMPAGKKQNADTLDLPIAPTPTIRAQRERVARFLEVKRGGGDHILYLGYHIVEGEALMDVFLHWRDEWEDLIIGLPIYVLVDISGTDIRFATVDEKFYFLNNKLPHRKHKKLETLPR